MIAAGRIYMQKTDLPFPFLNCFIVYVVASIYLPDVMIFTGPNKPDGSSFALA
jgi:hypothetical protein